MTTDERAQAIQSLVQKFPKYRLLVFEYITSRIVPETLSFVKTEQSDVKTEQSDVKTEQSDVKTEQSDMKTEQSDVKTEQSDVKTEQSDVKTEQSDVNLFSLFPQVCSYVPSSSTIQSQPLCGQKRKREEEIEHETPQEQTSITSFDSSKREIFTEKPISKFDNISHNIDDFLDKINNYTMAIIKYQLYDQIYKRLQVGKTYSELSEDMQLIEVKDTKAFITLYKSLFRSVIIQSAHHLRKKIEATCVQEDKTGVQEDKNSQYTKIKTDWMYGWIKIRNIQNSDSYTSLKIDNFTYKQIGDVHYYDVRNKYCAFRYLQKYYLNRRNHYTGEPEKYYIYDISGMNEHHDQKFAAEVIISFSELSFEKETWHGFHKNPYM